MNIEVRNELRPCLVTLYKFNREVGFEMKDKVVSGIFHGIWQYARPYDAVLVGHTSGQIAKPVAVVEINGKLQTTNVRDVEFTDVVKDDEVMTEITEKENENVY